MPLAVTPRTRYAIECWRAGVLIWTEAFPNLVTIAGRSELLNAAFRAGKAATAWSVGLVSAAGFTAYAESDTMAAHPGWVESAAYSQATRPTFLPSAPAAASLNNLASRAVFTANSYVTIRGAFLVDNGVKGGATGTLYGIGDFGTPRTVVAGDTLRAALTLSA